MWVAPAGGTPQARDPNLTPRSDSSTQGPARHLGSVGGGGARQGDRPGPAEHSACVSVLSLARARASQEGEKLHPGKRDQPQMDGTIPCEARRAWG